jgi:hypothetical protein
VTSGKFLKFKCPGILLHSTICRRTYPGPWGMRSHQKDGWTETWKTSVFSEYKTAIVLRLLSFWKKYLLWLALYCLGLFSLITKLKLTDACCFIIVSCLCVCVFFSFPLK